MRGKFLTFEGIDGAGKSSHLHWLADCLRARHIEVVTTREPGGTPLGERLREIVLNVPMHPDTEALLVFAARREHLARLIVPTIERGAWVINDRFTDSTYAYQCGGRGLDAERVATLEQWVHGDLQPDLTLLFDAPVELARERLEKGTAEPDKFEREQSEFFARVRAAYLARAEAFTDRIKVINSAQSIENIRVDISTQIDALFVNSAE